MKKRVALFSFLFLIYFYNTLNAAQIDGPANARVSPKGDIVLILNDGVSVNVIASEGDWFHISFNAVVDKSVLIEGDAIPKNTILKDIQGNEIGKTLDTMRVTSPSKKSDKVLLHLRVYTFKDNIKQILARIESTIIITTSLTVEEYKIARNTKELSKDYECFSLTCIPGEVLTKREKWRAESYDKRKPKKDKDGKVLSLELVYPDTDRIQKYEFVGLEVKRKPVEIRLGGRTVYKGEITDYPFDDSVKGLYVYNSHWVFEFMEPDIKDKKYYGTVVLDGVNLNKKYDYKEVFTFVFIKDKPFYFFTDKSGDTKINYAGKVLPIKYDEVLHYACCSDSAFNPDWNNSMVWFYAMRDGSLYYVEIGAY
jgi:hypothetical protein